MSKKILLLTSFSLIFFGFLSLAQNSSVFADWLLDRSGTLVQVDAAVLGDSDSLQETNREQAKKALEIRTEAAKKNLENQAETRKKTLELNQQTRQSELEIKDNKLKVKQELRNQAGKVIRRTEQELSEDEPLHVEREDGQKLEVKAIKDDELELKGEKVRTRTHFPITIGANNELIITKKDGTQKVVTVLPDAAVKNLEAKGFVTSTTPTDLAESSDGTPVYKFQGEQEKKVLGLFKRKFKKSVEVSVETGEVVGSTNTDPSPFSRLLERLSF